MKRVFAKFLLTVSVLSHSVVGVQVLTDYSESALATAIAQGGPVRFPTNGIITLSRPISIERDVQLDATGWNVTLDGRGSNRIFEISNAEVTVSNVAFANGNYRGTNAHVLRVSNWVFKAITPAEHARGGAIVMTNAKLQLFNCSFSTNLVMGGQGSGYQSFSPYFRIDEPGGDAFGGAIFAQNSRIRLDNCLFLENVSLGSPGTYFAFSRPYFSRPGSAFGGAICITNSELIARHSTFLRCSAGALDTSDSGAWGVMYGGALAAYNSSTELRNCTFSDNSAFRAPYGRGGTARGGAVFHEGGQLTVDSTIFSLNSAICFEDYSEGGALWVSSAAQIQRCSFISNSVKGGDMGTLGNGQRPTRPGRGGAIAAFSPIDISHSTFAFNVITGGTAIRFRTNMPIGEARGGAIFSTTNATIRFSTIASNRLVVVPSAGSMGAGLPFGGGIFSSNTVSLQACILSGNSPANFDTNSFPLVDDQGGNVNSDSSYIFVLNSSINRTDPKLDRLTFFSTNYAFFPLTPESPAIARASAPPFPTTDQVGFPRTAPDSGALEWQGTERKFALSMTSERRWRVVVHDPTYSTDALEQSKNLLEWTRLPISDFRPIDFSSSEKQHFLRFKTPYENQLRFE